MVKILLVTELIRFSGKEIRQAMCVYVCACYTPDQFSSLVCKVLK